MQARIPILNSPYGLEATTTAEHARRLVRRGKAVLTAAGLTLGDFLPPSRTPGHRSGRYRPVVAIDAHHDPERFLDGSRFRTFAPYPQPDQRTNA